MRWWDFDHLSFDIMSKNYYNLKTKAIRWSFNNNFIGNSSFFH
jgi:hypothetical protein